MPAQHAKRHPLVVANARHGPSHGCDELQGYLLGRPMPSELLAHREAESVGTLESLTGSLKVTRPAALDLNLG